jgi:perosamine synthetase
VVLLIERRIPFAKPCFVDEDVDEIMNGIQEVLRSGWLTSGPNVQKLEEKFAEFVGSSYAVGVNSCTAALHAILLALGVRSGDEVIVPTNTFVATANVALYVGAKPIFADSDPETFNISYEDVQRKISDKTRAIIVVHLGGNPCDMKEIGELAEDHGIALIEDCAHAHGAKYRGTSCGNLGVCGAFSFYPTKLMTTAEGGMITTNQKELAEKIKVIRNCGRGGYGPLEIVELGYNYRLSEIHAIIGLSQFRHLDEFIRHRNLIAKIYNKALSEKGWIRPQLVREGNLCSYYAYIVKLTEKALISRDELVSKLKDRGVMTSILYHPAHLQPLYSRYFDGKPPVLPVAEDLGKTSLALPMYSGMSLDDALYVVDVVKSLVGESEEMEVTHLTYV